MEKKLIDALHKRYATKRFDVGKKLSDKQLETLIEAVRLTATSYGLQLMKLVLVEDQKIREKLVEYSFGQEQVKDASNLFVLCRERKLSEVQFDNHINNISTTRSIPMEKLEKAKNNMINSILQKPISEQEIWMEKQVYIALGNLLSACAVIGVDACPMEGFIPTKYDEILKLEEKNLASVLVVPVGFRSEEDAYYRQKKVRRPKEQLVVKIK